MTPDHRLCISPWPDRPRTWRDTAWDVVRFVRDFLALVGALAGICVVFFLMWGMG